ncbi:MAG: Holliday junction branch migration protein RuvA [Candidatus Paceibacterota bacterium]
MIGTLRGTIIIKNLRSAIIEVGGVGYQVFLPIETLESLAIGDEIKCHTHLAVRENALELFGFLTEDEYVFFTLLIGVSGIGPKSALAIISLASPETLRQAIRAEDTGYLTKVSGIGRKNAEKIIIELKDKLGQSGSGENGGLRAESDILDSLLAIGFSLADARLAIKKLPTEIEDTNEKIKAAIKILGQK